LTETQIVLFIVTSLLLIITPGQDMILVMSRSISQGSKAGVATAAGVCTGLVGHTILAALGLGAVLRTSETLFTIVKLALRTCSTWALACCGPRVERLNYAAWPLRPCLLILCRARSRTSRIPRWLSFIWRICPSLFRQRRCIRRQCYWGWEWRFRRSRFSSKRPLGMGLGRCRVGCERVPRYAYGSIGSAVAFWLP
jgi:hypothetical protein